MTRTLGAGRWRLMPNRQRVTLLQQTQPGVFAPHSVSDAWYRDGIHQERAPTGGVYTMQSTDWFFAKELIDVAPKAGDRIQSTTAGVTTEDTVLTRQDALNQTVWKLGCLSLEVVYQLSTTVDIETYLLGRDASLGVTRTPTPLALGVKARVQPISEQAARERGLEYSETQVEITLATLPPKFDVLEGRVTDRTTGKVYAIVSTRSPELIGELPVIIGKAQQ